MTEDFYDLLEVAPDASQQEIREAFREKVRLYHPDLNDDERARAQFTALKKAYDVLNDKTEREAYDRLGHNDYVAKRMKGLPSPKRWKNLAEPDQSSDSSGIRTTTGQKSTTSSHRAGRARGGTRQTGTSGRRTATASARSDGGMGRASGFQRNVGSIPFGDNQLVQWLVTRSFALPLIWIATVTYVLGLVAFGIQNGSALAALREELSGAGSHPGDLWSVLSADHHAVESVSAYVAGAEPIDPPLDPSIWYPALGAIVTGAVFAVLLARVYWRDDPLGTVTVNEVFVIAVALGVATGLAGGPLLAGALVLPLALGIVIRSMRRYPGWAPSYVYAGATTAPLAGLLAGQAGYQSLPVDLVAFVLLPIGGVLGLFVRLGLRKYADL